MFFESSNCLYDVYNIMKYNRLKEFLMYETVYTIYFIIL